MLINLWIYVCLQKLYRNLHKVLGLFLWKQIIFIISYDILNDLNEYESYKSWIINNNMNLKPKGKGLAFIGEVITDTNISKSYEGAIDSNYFIKSQMKDKTWKLARIKGIRLSGGNQYNNN